MRWLSDCLKDGILLDRAQYWLSDGSAAMPEGLPDPKACSSQKSQIVEPASKTSDEKTIQEKFVKSEKCAETVSKRSDEKKLQDKFGCAHPSRDGAEGGGSGTTNHNKAITDQLEKLAKAYKNSNDTW